MHLILENFSISRNGVTLLKNLTFSAQKGQILYLTGANGVGKTTLLRSIANLHKEYSGTITFTFGGAVKNRHLYCDYLGQKLALQDYLTVKENLNFWDKTNQTTFLPNSLCKELSSGQRKYIALCRLLASQRPIWLLDEPFLYLDKNGQNFLSKILSEHSKKGGISIIATHKAISENVLNLNDFI